MPLVKDILKWAAGEIKHNTSSAIPEREAELLAEYLLGISREKLYMNLQDRFPVEYLDVYEDMVRERSSGKPLAYITGEKEFMSINFHVTPSVLIPRPETEILVEKVIEWLNKRCIKSPLILDIGTGSGAIALSLAKYLPESFIHLSDISEEALHVARKNALKFSLMKQLCFHSGDLFTPLEKGALFFDVIVSNPPYVSPKEIQKLPADVRDYEPEIALISPDDGLYFFKKILSLAPDYLKNSGLLALEAGAGQAKRVSEFFKENKLKNIQIIKDLSGIERVLMGEKNAPL